MIRFLAGLLAAGALAAGVAAAEEVTIPHGGKTLNGNLELAEGKSMADGIVVLVHGTLAHNGMELIAAQQSLLEEREISSLAINLSLGLDDRHGMYDCATPHTHHHRDAVAEIAAWVAWLKGRGAKSVTVMGHSRGGAQTALYAAQAPDRVVEKVILLAPGTSDSARIGAEYEKRHGVSLALLLDQAKGLVAAGRGGDLMAPVDFLYCNDAKVAAAAFLDYYAPSPDLDGPGLVDRIKLPVLAIVGTADTVVPDARPRLKEKAGGHLRVVEVQDAGHFFRDLYGEDVADAVQEFLAD
ncbi:MAG: alpha/beta hydrolase [Hyphomicrobiales bacterium]|nr:alpha/beta hydrolase [Hyphomicrobiales bacterium]MCP5374407.1 alpha/beta hydrolase [Hyphomicrobiales bacterium]